jgi:hypothetical protein
MNYLSREEIMDGMECRHYDPITAEIMIRLHDEIDRLTAMLPKVVVPKFDGDYYNCDCGQTVGDILYDVTNPYCVSCGARMDWDKAAEVAEQEHDYKAVQEAKQANDFIPLDLDEIFGADTNDEVYPVKYVDKDCRICGRHRVELMSNGDLVCEKCSSNQCTGDISESRKYI